MRPALSLIRTKRGFTLLAAVFALCAVPFAWYAKNWWFYGNPLEPFFQWLFAPHNAAANARERFYIDSHHPQPIWTLDYWRSFVPRLIVIPPILLAPTLCLISSRVRRRIPGILRLVSFCLLSYMLWNLVGASEDRFLIPVMLILTALGFCIISKIECGISRGVVVALLLVWSALNLFQQGLKFSSGNVFSFVMESDFYHLSRGPEISNNPIPDKRDDFLESNLGAVGSITNHANLSLPANARVLMIFEARPWLIRRASAHNTVWDDSVFLSMVDDVTTSAQIWQRLGARGFTHVLVNRQELRRYIQQYVLPSQLQKLGISPNADHALAFDATSTPEDLFPPFYRNAKWEHLRGPVIAFLREAETRASDIAGPGKLRVFLTPVP